MVSAVASNCNGNVEAPPVASQPLTPDVKMTTKSTLVKVVLGVEQTHVCVVCVLSLRWWAFRSAETDSAGKVFLENLTFAGRHFFGRYQQDLEVHLNKNFEAFLMCRS